MFWAQTLYQWLSVWKKWHGDRGNHVEPKIRVMNLDFAVNITIYGGAQLRVGVELFSTD